MAGRDYDCARCACIVTSLFVLGACVSTSWPVESPRLVLQITVNQLRGGTLFEPLPEFPVFDE
jgi:hypothetical protein